MKYNIEEIIELIPSGWDNMKLSTYLKFSDIIIKEDETDIFNGFDNTLMIVSKITNIPFKELEKLPMGDVIKIGQKINYISNLPKVKRSKLKWKELNEITYDDFITFLQVEEKTLSNIHTFIANFTKNKLTEEEVLNMSVEEVWSGFFLFKKKLMKSLNISIVLTKMKAIALLKKEAKEKGQELPKKIKRWFWT
jgi:hypothetical protein